MKRPCFACYAAAVVAAFVFLSTGTDASSFETRNLREIQSSKPTTAPTANDGNLFEGIKSQLPTAAPVTVAIIEYPSISPTSVSSAQPGTLPSGPSSIEPSSAEPVNSGAIDITYDGSGNIFAMSGDMIIPCEIKSNLSGEGVVVCGSLEMPFVLKTVDDSVVMVLTTPDGVLEIPFGVQAESKDDADNSEDDKIKYAIGIAAILFAALAIVGVTIYYCRVCHQNRSKPPDDTDHSENSEVSEEDLYDMNIHVVEVKGDNDLVSAFSEDELPRRRAADLPKELLQSNKLDACSTRSMTSRRSRKSQNSRSRHSRLSGKTARYSVSGELKSDEGEESSIIQQLKSATAAINGKTLGS